MSPFVFTNLLKKLHQQLVNWIIFSAIVVCLLNYNTVIMTNGINKASKHGAGYGKYVLLVCTYLNANVNETLVIIREGLPYGTIQVEFAVVGAITLAQSVSEHRKHYCNGSEAQGVSKHAD